MFDDKAANGRSLYYQITTKFGGGAPLSNEAQEAASKHLKELGIPGIKYFDGNSRKAGKGTRNFVVFDENDMQVLTRNGEDLPKPTGLLDNSGMDYRIEHTAPMRDGLNTLDDATGIMPDDFYDSSVSWNYYGHGGDSVAIDKQSAGIIAGFKGKPNKPLTIYRAVPHEKGLQEQVDELVKGKNHYLKRGSVPKGMDNGLEGSEWYDDVWDKIGSLQERIDNGEDALGELLDINKGDWVTVNRNYAKQHGETQLNGNYKIVSKKVRAKDIATDGNSIHEWGYDPK
jgi:hypothetical protein